MAGEASQAKRKRGVEAASISSAHGMPRLTGKVAVVTGGNRGIGLAIARALAAEGCSIAITGRDRKALKAACGELAEVAGSAPGSSRSSVPSRW